MARLQFLFTLALSIFLSAFETTGERSLSQLPNTDSSELDGTGADTSEEQLVCGNGTMARFLRTKCSSDQTEYFTFKNSVCEGDPERISQGGAELTALYQCEKADDSKFGVRYAGYGEYIYSACVDGNIVLEVHDEEGCTDDTQSFVYPSQDCSPMCVPITPAGYGLETPCFEEVGGQPIVNCTCDLSCLSCGYSSWPDQPNDCIACKDGLILYNGIGVDTGYCAPPPETKCFAEVGGEPIDGCTCEPSCQNCGYGEMPNGPHDCITCAPGLVFHALFADGTGYCLDEAAPSICYEDYISLTDTVISGCQCDPTCNTCGFDSWPSDPEDCIDCKFPLTQLAKDPNTMLGACTPAGLCYESPNSDPIEGCTCDPTCGSCGYSENPTGPNNCITCMYWTYGQLIINQTTKNADGTGECVPPMYCYLDQDHRRARSPIPNCECHHNCLVCGYGFNPNGYDQCITCVDGLYMNQVTNDDTGFCSTTPCVMFCAGAMGIRLGPYANVAFLAMGAAVVTISLVAYQMKKRVKAFNHEDVALIDADNQGIANYGSQDIQEGQPLIGIRKADQAAVDL